MLYIPKNITKTIHFGICKKKSGINNLYPNNNQPVSPEKIYMMYRIGYFAFFPTRKNLIPATKRLYRAAKNLWGAPHKEKD